MVVPCTASKTCAILLPLLLLLQRMRTTTRRTVSLFWITMRNCNQQRGENTVAVGTIGCLIGCETDRMVGETDESWMDGWREGGRDGSNEETNERSLSHQCRGIQRGGARARATRPEKPSGQRPSNNPSIQTNPTHPNQTAPKKTNQSVVQRPSKTTTDRKR